MGAGYEAAGVVGTVKENRLPRPGARLAPPLTVGSPLWKARGKESALVFDRALGKSCINGPRPRGALFLDTTWGWRYIVRSLVQLEGPRDQDHSCL